MQWGSGRNADATLRRYLTNLGSLLLSIVFIAFGAGLLLLVGYHEAKGPSAWLSLGRDFGSLFVVTGVFTIVWELVGRRALFDEFWTRAQLAESVRAAGLSHVADSFRSGVDWPLLLNRATRLDVFFSYGRTWRNTHSELLEQILRRNGHIRVVLPDPDNPAIMSELARRFEQSEEEIVRVIRESTSAFSQMGANNAAGERLQIWVIPHAPLLTFYRVDHKAVIATYRHQRGRGSVPAFVMDAGGFLFEFVRQEFDAMMRGPNPLARRVV